jgi:hypothetical protein
MNSVHALMTAVASVGVAAASHAQVTLSASMTVDNTFTAYISSSPTVQGTQFLTGNNWNVTYSGSTVINNPGTYYLQILATDLGRPEMFIGQFSLTNFSPGFSAAFQNASTILLTDVTNWRVSNTGFGVNETAVRDLGPNGTAPWGTRPSISPSARFLWAPQYTSTVYFSTTITVVPAPAALAPVVLAGLAATRRRR